MPKNIYQIPDNQTLSLGRTVVTLSDADVLRALSPCILAAEWNSEGLQLWVAALPDHGVFGRSMLRTVFGWLSFAVDDCEYLLTVWVLANPDHCLLAILFQGSWAKEYLHGKAVTDDKL
jgi:hypothetical protein